MTEADYTKTLIELDRLLNDPDVPMQPDRIWAMLADLTAHDRAMGVRAQAEPVPAGG